MLNAIKFLVGSSQHVFPEIFYKTILLLRKAKFQTYFLEKPLTLPKGTKKITYNTLLWLLLFFTFLLSYERLKTYFPTSAQEISAIFGHFPILKQQ